MIWGAGMLSEGVHTNRAGRRRYHSGVLSQSLCLSVSLSLSSLLSPSFSLSLSPSFSPSLSLSVSFPVSLCVSLSFPSSLSLSHSLTPGSLCDVFFSFLSRPVTGNHGQVCSCSQLQNVPWSECTCMMTASPPCWWSAYTVRNRYRWAPWLLPGARSWEVSVSTSSAFGCPLLVCLLTG